jgi:hypothetical protein
MRELRTGLEVAAMIEYVVVASAEPAALAACGHHD